MGHWFSKEEKEEVIIAQTGNGVAGNGVASATTSLSEVTEYVVLGMVVILICRVLYRFMKKKMEKEIRKQIAQSTANLASSRV